jgi:hypothetical protein
METLGKIFQILLWIGVIIMYALIFILLFPIMLIDALAKYRRKKIVIIVGLLLVSQFSFAGHIAKFTNSGTIFRTGEPRAVQFIDKTQDIFGKPLQNMRYIWDFGDGVKSDKSNPIHQYNNWGMFTVDLTVIDTISNFSSDYTKQINIERFKDTCIVLETVYMTSFDTIFFTQIDTVTINVFDTITYVKSIPLNLNDVTKGIYDTNGRYRGVDSNGLKTGIYFIITRNGFNIMAKKIYIIN